MENITFEVTYKNKRYTLNSGLDAYIFQNGIYESIDEEYGEEGLLQYVAVVRECYLSDDNPTPLGELSYFVAMNFDRLK